MRTETEVFITYEKKRAKIKKILPSASLTTDLQTPISKLKLKTVKSEINQQ